MCIDISVRIVVFVSCKYIQTFVFMYECTKIRMCVYVSRCLNETILLHLKSLLSTAPKYPSLHIHFSHAPHQCILPVSFPCYRPRQIYRHTVYHSPVQYSMHVKKIYFVTIKLFIQCTVGNHKMSTVT